MHFSDAIEFDSRITSFFERTFHFTIIHTANCVLIANASKSSICTFLPDKSDSIVEVEDRVSQKSFLGTSSIIFEKSRSMLL